MKKLISLCLITAMATTVQAQHQNSGYPISPVTFTQVKIAQNSFWGQRLEAARNITIPLAFSKCESEGRYRNFWQAAHPSTEYKVGGYSFDDTDVYKTIEGASYILQTYPDKQLTAYIDSVLDIVAAAQEPDGYLYTARTMNPAHPHDWSGPTRWVKEEDLSHELYNLGHMVEAAVAHWQATGSRKFLNIACRYADCVVREVGPNAGQACVVPGHQIAEMALAKLYLATGEKKYLDEAKFFLDYRGRTTIKHQYSQAHKPVTEQDEAVGHAVRAAYMYAGMADVAALTGDSAYIKAIDKIWENIVTKKLYITGGIGATNAGEAFGRNYELPNLTAYCETCAAIGNVYVNHRLFLLHGESKYYDVLERTLYNGVISGMSIDGGKFFYPNPLASNGSHERQAWFGCACCPSNLCRFIPSLPGYVYAVKDRNVYVNLFNENRAELNVGGKKVAISQHTEYPWNGSINITVDKNNAGEFAMKIRIPGWAKGDVVPSDLYTFADKLTTNYSVKVNGTAATGSLTADGYYTINRKWRKGDVVELTLDMPVRIVKANEKVEADRNSVAVQRGPIVYCAEKVDNPSGVKNVLLNQHPTFKENNDFNFSFDAADGHHSYKLTALETTAQTLSYDSNGQLTAPTTKLTLIPYFAWCHRGKTDMKVWLTQNVLN